jgi:hypothetical protein
MSAQASSHAYGIGVISLLVGMSVVLVFYTSFYLPESLLKPSVSEDILEPETTLTIDIVLGALLEGNDAYIPEDSEVLLTIDNHVIWTNSDETAHTVTPDHRYADSYSGDFGSVGVILPGETYEFVFTEPTEVHYHCTPHPWMKGSITIAKSRF